MSSVTSFFALGCDIQAVPKGKIYHEATKDTKVEKEFAFTTSRFSCLLL